MRRLLSIASLVLLLAGCGDGSSGDLDGGASDTGLLGTWVMTTAGVDFTVSLSGTEASGTAQTMQSTMVGGDLPTCRVLLVGDGTFTTSGGSITIVTSSARQRTEGCNDPDTDVATDVTPLQNFADALSGPYVLTETTLQLGSSYPEFSRLTR